MVKRKKDAPVTVDEAMRNVARLRLLIGENNPGMSHIWLPFADSIIQRYYGKDYRGMLAEYWAVAPGKPTP